MLETKGKVHHRACVKVFLVVMILDFLGAVTISCPRRTLGAYMDVGLLTYFHVSQVKMRGMGRLNVIKEGFCKLTPFFYHLDVGGT